MTPAVISVAAEARVDHAVWSLSAKGVSGAPVCAADGAVVGVLSRSDLIDSEAHALVPGDSPVAQVMTPRIVAIHPDAPASEAVELMVAKSVHRVLVMQGEGELVGILTSMDVMKAIAAGLDLRPKRREPLSRPEREAAGGS
ncbi:CBS domain-containing protein [Haliangium sp.]|uniref:CBS domain-containing protein n=1 Tax=Haliangium sp. TaxID=2663208 RepID=UPI003D0B1332